jgi:hypothetical protein
MHSDDARVGSGGDNACGCIQHSGRSCVERNELPAQMLAENARRGALGWPIPRVILAAQSRVS